MSDLIVKLCGARVLLRPWSLNDATALFGLASDAVVADGAGFPAHTDVSGSRRVIRDVLASPECYAVVLHETGEVVGCIQVFVNAGRSVYKEEVVEMGFWLGRSYWGQGLIPEAVSLLIDRCFNSGAFDCLRVVGKVASVNSASKRVFEKCGFSKVGDGIWCEYELARPVGA